MFLITTLILVGLYRYSYFINKAVYLNTTTYKNILYKSDRQINKFNGRIKNNKNPKHIPSRYCGYL